MIEKSEDKTKEILKNWFSDPRWKGIQRTYLPEEVTKAEPKDLEKYDLSFSKTGAKRLWKLLHEEPGILLAHAILDTQSTARKVKSGMRVLHLETPEKVKQAAHAMLRDEKLAWYAPIVAGGGVGGADSKQVFLWTQSMIKAGAAAVYFDDRMNGRVVIPIQSFVQLLNSARLASDMLDVPLIIAARIHVLDIEAAIEKAIACAPFADILWCETQRQDLDAAARFSRAIIARYPDKILGYRCLPKVHRDAIAKLRRLGYRLHVSSAA